MKWIGNPGYHIRNLYTKDVSFPLAILWYDKMIKAGEVWIKNHPVFIHAVKISNLGSNNSNLSTSGKKKSLYFCEVEGLDWKTE